MQKEERGGDKARRRFAKERNLSLPTQKDAGFKFPVANRGRKEKRKKEGGTRNGCQGKDRGKKTSGGLSVGNKETRRRRGEEPVRFA